MYKQLFEAAKNGDLQDVTKLVGLGVDVNAVDKYGDTTLHLATENGHAAIVEYLVTRGADVNTINEDGDTALHWAAYCGHAAIVELLVSNGADMTAVNKGGDTALHLAARYGHQEIAHYLDKAMEAKFTKLAAAAYAAYETHEVSGASTAGPLPESRRSAVLALISENDALRNRLGIKNGLEVKADFDICRLVEIAIKRREGTDTSLRADVEAEIDFRMEAARMLSDDIDVGNPMRPWRR